ncbi:ATP-binding cassette domain-containing protein [Castellaniella sp.]|uniref:ATP-binding cassette domain-containing protein n=1 Tax=Castellaniella sp. TaxID=1955812 RepID=UPI00355DD72A
MTDTVLALSKAQLAYGHHPLLDHADLQLQAGERIGLIGRNGAGKSSLLRVLAGSTTLDDGEIRRSPSLRVALVAQEPEFPAHCTVGDHLVGDVLASEDWSRPARADQFMATLGLSHSQTLSDLSGGQRKRVALARALIDEPDLLLLDEPTNHLDFDGIAWLEDHLLKARLTLVVITHDRRFLDTVATRIIELDRGQILSFPGNFSRWQEHKAQWLEAEALAQARFDKFLTQEEAWIRKGVEARRTRNEGRVRRLEGLRRQRAARREIQGQVRFSLTDGQRSGKRVIELESVDFGYDDTLLVRNFSSLIQRGDRVGLIGPNGAGKTTLLRLMLGELTPLRGHVQHGTHLSIAYFDQMRNMLDEQATLADTISPGSEWVEIGGQRRHVMGYLEEFLFPPQRARSPVSSLSGGERARLALARLFAQAHNVLVLDEPTNDLDIDTLELLEALLQDYAGTVLMVSHDRTFLDNIVTQVIVAEGDGHWAEYVGGYTEWQARQGPGSVDAADTAARPSRADHPQGAAASAAASTAAPRGNPPAAHDSQPTPRKNRLAPWEEKELAELPDRIAELETRQANLAQSLSNPDLYKEGGTEGSAQAQAIQDTLDQTHAELEALFERWAALEARNEN